MEHDLTHSSEQAGRANRLAHPLHEEAVMGQAGRTRQ
jgi:hypothetical protein